MDQDVKVSILKVLCRGLSSGSSLSCSSFVRSTVSNCSSFVVIFPGMVFNISVRFCNHSRSTDYHWYHFGILQLPGSFHFILEVLVFGHFS